MRVWKALTTVVMLALPCAALDAQDAVRTPSSQSLSMQDSIEALRQQTGEIKLMLEQMRAELAQSRSETLQLRQELERTRQQLAAAASRDEKTEPELRSVPEQTVQRLQEEQELLDAKVEEQHQTKVESASKYRVRLSGAVLMNLFSNRGAVDNLDFPHFSLAGAPIYSRGNFGASVRQSLIGLEVFGPEIRGARVSADAQLDFAGGFPNAPDGLTFPLPRLRTAVVRWTSPTTTVVAGQDVPFFSPLSPDSVASIAEPALSYAGNLWTWIPQLRIDHRFGLGDDSTVLVQGGILDPLTGNPPFDQFFRAPQAGEASRQPAYASRVALTRHRSGRELTIGTGGYYSRQAWGLDRYVNSWAGTSDWMVPISGRLELAGEFYYGRGIGGLGGGFGRSVLVSGPITDPLTKVNALNSRGGWAQLKFHHTEKLEWNGTFGLGTVAARDLRVFPLAVQTYYDPSIARNQSSLLNFIYRPRSDMLFSLEFHRLRTLRIDGNSARADQVNLSMGVLF